MVICIGLLCLFLWLYKIFFGGLTMNFRCRIQRAYFFLPACAAATALAVAGCSNQTELLLPEGAFTPENQMHVPAGNVSPEPGIGVQNPAGSTSVGGTMNLEAEMDIQPTPAPAPAPVPAPAPAPVAKKQAAAGDVVYKVKKGDTLSAIAKRYNLHWRALAEYNKLDAKGRIYPGQTLRIPAVSSSAVAEKKAAAESGKLHVVKKGEYPGKIAAMYKVKLDDLLALNNLKGKKTIYVGQKLRIPAAVPVVANKKQTAVKKADKKPQQKKTAPQKKVVADKKKNDIPVIKKEEKKVPAGDTVVRNDMDSKPVAENIGSEPVTKNTNVAVAPAADKDVASDMPTLDMKLEKDMTLEQVAQAFDRSIDTLKKYNPTLKSGEVISAGTSIVVPIF